MEETNLIKVRHSGRTSRYCITKEGRGYLQSENRFKYLHKLLYKHVLHYSYFYDYILDNISYLLINLNSMVGDLKDENIRDDAISVCEEIKDEIETIIYYIENVINPQ